MPTQSELSRDAPPIAAATTVGPVSLTVADLPRMREFYETVLGLEAVELPDGDLELGPPGGPGVVRMHAEPHAPVRDPHSPGLFHLAILLPTRAALADALLRVARARRPLNGASDHLVSEALYLSDPEGNGIELYRDRARTQWPRDASGALRMATLALDLDDLLGDAPSSVPDPRAPAGTGVGHVHLQVADIPRAEAFYCGGFGFEATVRGYPGALFVSAGGYHHHIGLNTWNSAGSPPAAPGARGLRWFEITVPDGDELARVYARLARAGARPAGDPPGELRLHDPFGIPLRVRTA
jgi:catechol 2,3-dioxygenase